MVYKEIRKLCILIRHNVSLQTNSAQQRVTPPLGLCRRQAHVGGEHKQYFLYILRLTKYLATTRNDCTPNQR